MATNFRQLAVGALVLGSLISGSAQAQTAPFNMVWDNFASGFTQGATTSKWYHASAGPLAFNNGTTMSIPNGLYVGAPINPSTNLPTFTLTLGQEAANGGFPGALDHVKWASYMNHTATSGFMGFDAVPGQELSCSARIIGQTFGTRLHPFGSKAQNENVDLRLATFGALTFDPETSLAFDFLFTNRRIYAVYERLAMARTTTHYAAFTYAIPVGNRTKDTAHSVSIAYNRSAGTVRWLLDGQEVYRISTIGHRLSSTKDLIVDNGGVNQTVVMRQLNCGMGMFTLLDGANGSQSGLVRLSSTPNLYFQPSKGAPNPLSFVDETSQHHYRLFGQGAEFRIGAYSVASTSTTASTPPPIYVEPAPIVTGPGDSMDGFPQYGEIP